MTLCAPNWEIMPEKKCFVACPENRYCECRERMRWERSKLDFDFLTNNQLTDDQIFDTFGIPAQN